MRIRYNSTKAYSLNLNFLDVTVSSFLIDLFTCATEFLFEHLIVCLEWPLQQFPCQLAQWLKAGAKANI